ncbi:hypothetical protein ONZ43_g6265 [Nemania bipapillata]|uniref:Uncharacterized protein n=1 Tax=Nemania bipapillata TaxID=110536 RepID=A0ACC2I1V2_9PEZI|nr:hypothetical protein ONZ43_g6265 [Nemania bipapillata]
MSAKASDHITSTEWSEIAPTMMQMTASGPGVAPAQHMAEHADKLLPFSKATFIVDMGCGPGQVTNAVLEAHNANIPKSAKFIGADNNAEMLACDALEDDSVSHMLAGFVIFLVPNPAQAIASIKRVMAPGGVLAMCAMLGGDWAKLSMYPLKVCPGLAMDVPPNGCSSREDVTNHLKNAGFTDIEVIDVENHMEFDDYDVVCRFLLNKLPMAARAIAQMTNEQIIQTQEMMVADLKSWYPTLPARMKGQTNIAYARNFNEMPLKLYPALPADADRISEIHMAAFASNAMLLAQFPTREVREGLKESIRLKALADIEDRNITVLVVRDAPLDSDAPDMTGAEDDGRCHHKVEEVLKAPNSEQAQSGKVIAFAKWSHPIGKNEEYEETPWVWPAGTNMQVLESWSKATEEAQDQAMGDLLCYRK